MRKKLFGSVAAASILTFALGAAPSAHAQRATVPADIGSQFHAAAEEGGPGALLQALDGILKQRPQLAASPDSAAALAREAATAVRTFRGANLPVYRGIIDRIVSAAPAASRNAVSNAVVAEVNRAASVDPQASTRLPPGTTVEGPQQRLVIGPGGQPQTTPRYGIPVGGFRLYPSADAALAYDDNVFATKTAKRNDLVAVLAMALVAESRGSSHTAILQGHVDVSRYFRYNRENALDFWLSGEGTYSISSNTTLFGGILGKRDHEDRDSPDDVAGSEPTIYWEERIYGGVSHRTGPWTLRLGSTYKHFDFEDAPSSAGRINNSDRSRSQLDSGVRVGYDFSSSFQLYAQLHHDYRNYDGSRDDNGFKRNSQGVMGGIGTRFSAGSTLEGDIFAGWMHQHYRDSRFTNVSTPALQGTLRWRPIAGTRLVGWFDRSIEETTFFGSPAYVLSSVGLRVEQDLTRDLSLTVRGGYARSDFQDSGRRDHDYEASVGLQYDITENYYIGADYRFQARRSNLGTADYNRNQVFLRLGVQY
ncbi:MAG: outer membrane beta-barrel protein [Burkholderiales bacterium]|nr:outer membrane beta-barrel protein [Dokdonella sp.]MCW5605410.1 outer membrane beta-barrel protein [Burkholderiales bacterium]